MRWRWMKTDNYTGGAWVYNYKSDDPNTIWDPSGQPRLAWISSAWSAIMYRSRIWQTSTVRLVTNNCTDFSYTFYYDKKLRSIDIHNWDMNKGNSYHSCCKIAVL